MLSIYQVKKTLIQKQKMKATAIYEESSDSSKTN